MAELVELGSFLDSLVATPDGDVLVSVRAPLLWSEQARALVVLVVELPRKRPIDLRGSTSERVYRRWARGREPASEREFEFSWPGEFAALGRGRTVGYRSDKFHSRGNTVDYQHEFGHGVRVFQAAAGDQGALVWRGGTLRVTPHGIEG